MKLVLRVLTLFIVLTVWLPVTGYSQTFNGNRNGLFNNQQHQATSQFKFSLSNGNRSTPSFSAQSNEEITLTVSSDGPTKDDAVKNALRSAIEQAYGAFVSANTTILNDDLVKDEIVTISSGAIKVYTIVSESEKPDGQGYMVTAKATVSLPHLITYAKNHGSECEFAGNTFGMQMKLWELQKKSELVALDNLYSQIEAILPSQIYWELKVGEPKVVHEIEHSDWIVKQFKNPDNVNLLNNLNPDDFYQVDFKLIGHVHPNYTQEEIQKCSSSSFQGYLTMDSPVYHLIKDGLTGIAMSKEEIKAAENRDEKLGEIPEFLGLKFRNNQEVLLDWMYKLTRLFRKEIFEGICIEDNNGIDYDPHLLEIINFIADPHWHIFADYIKPDYHDVPYHSALLYSYYLEECEDREKHRLDGKYMEGENNLAIAVRIYADEFAFIPGCTGLFRYPFEIMTSEVVGNEDIFYPLSTIRDPEYFYDSDNNQWIADIYHKCMPIKFTVLIPKEEIGKYSSFKIVKK
ncbi:MAG: hypothetical protein K2K98_13170 [Muribaculaceae bacterium]|nr:hypothetical protein [Muribaculaceae bacterium]